MTSGTESSTGGAARRGWRRLLWTSLALAVALAGLVAAFLWGVAVPGDWVRAPLERALTAAFGVPTRIEGSLRVHTGLSARLAADAMVLADPSSPAGVTIARAIRPEAQVDLLALARRVVALEEVTGERLELNLLRRADGRANWTPIFAAAPDGRPPPVTFGGIARLRITHVAGAYRIEGTDAVRFAIAALDGALPLRDAVTARGTATIAARTVAFDLRTASLEGLGSSGAAIPLAATLDWSGARLTIDGSVARDGPRLDAGVRLAADDAGQLLAAIGVAAHGPGRLDAQGRVSLTAAEAELRDVTLSLGKSTLAGTARVAWGAPRIGIAADLSGERIDLDPFLAAAPPARDQTAAEAFVALLDRAASGLDAALEVSVGELAGLPVTPRAVVLQGRSGDGTVALNGHGDFSGTRVKATLDYDARKPQRILAARAEGGAVSTAGLPGGARPHALSGTTAGIRGQARGQGASPRSIVASLQGSLDARDLRWTVSGHGGKPVSGRFDRLRIAVQGTRASSAEVTGKLGDAACRLKASGGALGPLLEGGQWPVQIAGSCPGGRLNAKGRIALAERHVAADLAFDAAADRIGPVVEALGIAPGVPLSFAARGALALDEKRARVRLDALRLGRTAGTGEVAFPFGADEAPRVRLALTAVNLEEINALGGTAQVPSDPLERVILREKLRLPDADFEIAADRVEVADAVLRRFHVSGAMRAGRLPPASFRFESPGTRVSGEFGVDFSGAAPRVQLSGTAQNADLGALLAGFGQAGIALRAGEATVRARAEGARLGELLASAALDAAIERGQLDLPRHPGPRPSGRADFSATLKAAPGQPATLAARGTMDGEPLELAFDTPGLAGLARAGEAIPATLRLALGDVRIQTAGRFARDATGDARVQLSGGRLDRLGRLLGVELPEVGPYSASGTVVASSDAIRASDLDVSVGRSRVQGRVEFQVKRAGRAMHSAALRAPLLHLEDMGVARWLGGPGRPKEGEAPAARRTEAEIARALERLRASDVDATVEVDALHGGDERFASGRLRATMTGGKLRVLLQDVRTEGGTIDADVRVDASGAQPKFAVRARVDSLEFGPLARTVDPATKLGGRLDLVADLAAAGPPGQLLPALAGTLDMAVFPHDLRPGGLEFWGTGLLSTMLRSLDPSVQSEVECAVASLDVSRGVASTSAFFVDTTRVRIIGQFDADLTTRALAGRLRPVSEQPELFTVAPTMVLGGTMVNPQVTVAPENIVLAPLRFATPLGGFALDWLSGKGRLQESAASCREAFDRARRARGGAPPGAKSR